MPQPIGASRLVGWWLEWWARAVPFHRGKQRLAEHLVDWFSLAEAGERVVWRQGAQWSLDPTDYVCRDLFWAGAKDVAQMRALRPHLPRGGVMFDLGANFGYYAIVMARALEQDCVIHAFEPDGVAAARLEANLALNDISCISVHRCGVSDHGGAASLQRVQGNSGAASLVDGHDFPLVTLDAFCADHGIQRVDVVKIDVEGAELRALRGAAGVLTRHRPTLLLELNAQALRAQGARIDDLLDLLADHRYVVRPIGSKHRAADLRRPQAIIDVLCTPRPPRAPV